MCFSSSAPSIIGTSIQHPPSTPPPPSPTVLHMSMSIPMSMHISMPMQMHMPVHMIIRMQLHMHMNMFMHMLIPPHMSVEFPNVHVNASVNHHTHTRHTSTATTPSVPACAAVQYHQSNHSPHIVEHICIITPAVSAPSYPKRHAQWLVHDITHEYQIAPSMAYNITYI